MFRVSIIVPTYNEFQNLRPLVEEVFSLVEKSKIDLEFIIVDDNSPDGTGQLAEEMSKEFPLKVIHRAGKMGLGSAVIAGFALSDRPYVGAMDADLSHDPSVLNNLIFALETNDISIGSRFSTGSYVEDWDWWRKSLSNVGVFLASKLSRVADPLSGYFFLRRSVIDGVALKTKGYKILFEILCRGKYSRIVEIPFNFRKRKFSASKLNFSEYILFMGQLIKFTLIKLYGKFF